MSESNSFLTVLFESLNNNKISYSVLRNYELLPYSLNGSDLDIFIPREDEDLFFDILTKSYKLFNGKLFINYGGVCPKLILWGQIDSDLWGCQIDMFIGNVSYKNYELVDDKTLLNHTEIFNGVKVLNSQFADIVAFYKEILNNGCCCKKYYNAIAYIEKHSLEHILLSFNNNLFDKNHIEKIIRIIDSGYNKELLSIFSKETKQLVKAKSKVIYSSRNLLKYKAKKISINWGFTIAFLGTDGSGKSTIIESIMPSLKETFHKGVFYEHMRPNLIPNIAQLFGKPKVEGPTVDPHEGKQSALFMSLIRLLYYTFDYIFGWIIKVYPKKVKKSCVWLFDRYYYDYLIDPKRGKIKLPKCFIKTVGLFIPKPDLILCLGTGAELIHDRKPELPLEEVKRQVEELKKFCDNNNRTVWIDTGVDLNDSVNNTMEAIVGMMSKKFNK